MLRRDDESLVTLPYWALELLLGAMQYSAAVDIWAAGCIWAEMAINRMCFPGVTHVDVLFGIFRHLGTPSRPTWPGSRSLAHWSKEFPKWEALGLGIVWPGLTSAIGNDGVELLQAALFYDPMNRPSVASVLSHKYFACFTKASLQVRTRAVHQG